MLHLQILSSSASTETISLDESQLPLTIGRDAANKLCLESLAISRFHAEIISQNGNYYIRDLKSTNGTFLNGRRIEKEKLGPGDEITIADVRLSVEAIQPRFHRESDPIHISVAIEKPALLERTLIATQPSKEMMVEAHYRFSNQSDLLNSAEALRSLYKADAVLRDIDDMNRLLENFTDFLLKIIPASKAYIFLSKPGSEDPLLYVRRGPNTLAKETQIVISKTILDMTLKRMESILARSALITESGTKPRAKHERAAISSICAPLASHEKILGFIYLEAEANSNYFSQDDLLLLSAMAAKASTAIDNARLYENLRNLFYNMVETLIRTMQAKDRYTSGHSTRVSRFSLLIADKLGLSTREKRQLYIAAMLHDIGKIALPDKLLLRPGKLTEEEMEMVKKHPQIGVSMIKSLEEMQPIIPLILHHHESYDGTGYPDGLTGDEIPLMSRIIAAADTYDAITSDRPYRKGKSREEAIRELKRVSGIKLDPKIVKAFLEVLEEISPKAKTSQPRFSISEPAPLSR